MTKSLSEDATMKEVHDKTLKLGTFAALCVHTQINEREKNHREFSSGSVVVADISMGVLDLVEYERLRDDSLKRFEIQTLWF